jgi:biopolymer transport protein ExbB/TolQ
MMTQVLESGGILMWPLLLLALGVIFLGARAALLLRRGERGDTVAAGLRAILFWGSMSVVLGLLGTTIGIVQMTQAIQLVEVVEERLVYGGIGVALVTSIFGLVIFTLSAILWFTLRQWQLRRTPA